MEVMPSNSVSLGSWYQSDKDLGVRRPKTEIPWVDGLSTAMIKISVNTDISVIRFYGYIGNIGKYRWIFLQKYRKR